MIRPQFTERTPAKASQMPCLSRGQTMTHVIRFVQDMVRILRLLAGDCRPVMKTRSDHGLLYSQLANAETWRDQS